MNDKNNINSELADIMRAIHCIGLKYDNDPPKELREKVMAIHEILMQIKDKYYVER